MTNEQEIKAKADQAVEIFFKIIAASYAENDIAQDIAHIMYDKDATQCAIIMYEDRVKLLQELQELAVKPYIQELTLDGIWSDVYVVDGGKLAESKAILNELKSRL